MHLISLNTWGGRVFEPLMNFVKTHTQNTDVFCFQEILATQSNKTTDKNTRVNLLSELQKTLGHEFVCFFTPTRENILEETYIDYPLQEGIATFIKQTIPIYKHGEIYIHRNVGDTYTLEPITYPRKLFYAEIEQHGKRITICNTHCIGLYAPKTDLPERLKQSHRIKKFLDQLTTPFIIIGDFNLLPNTESMAIIQKDLRNLITEYHVTNTRSTYYDWPDTFADYALVSKDIVIEQFHVLPDAISDHLALSVSFT